MMARAIASRLLHEPTVRIKGVADREDAYLQVSALRELFGLDAGTEPEAARAPTSPRSTSAGAATSAAERR